jgi:trimethylamine:corrinoid methyltransferase-like protein
MSGMYRPEGEMGLILIEGTGPGQQFVGHRHAFKRARAMSQDRLFDWARSRKWEAAGATTAHERALNIAGNHGQAYLGP